MRPNFDFIEQSSSDISNFNVQYYIQKLEEESEYEFPFTRIKQVEERLNDLAGSDDEEEKKEEPKVEELNADGTKKTDYDKIVEQ